MLKDYKKSKKQLISELMLLRQQNNFQQSNEEKIRSTDESYQLLLNNAQNGIFICYLHADNTYSNFREVNQTACELLGYSKEELLQLSPTDIDLHLKTGITLKKTSFTLNDHLEFETICLTKTQQQIPLKMHIHSFAFNNYRVLFCIAYDLKQSLGPKLPLHHHRQDFKTLAENSPDIIVRLDKNLRFIYANSTIKIPTGISAQTFIGARLPDMISDEYSIALWTEQINLVFEKKKPIIIQSKYKSPHNRLFFYDARVVPEFSADGTIQQVLCTIRNITDLKETEQALRKSQDRNQYLLNCLPDVLFMFNEKGIIRDYQSSHKELLTFAPEYFFDKSIFQLLPDVSPPILHHMEQALHSNKIQLFQFQVEIEKNIHFFDGRLIANSSTEFILICRDVTDLKQLQQQLVLFERLNLVGEMAVSIGHEIRNPMTTVRGFLQLFQRKAALLPYKESLNLMIAEIDHANMIITEFISLSKNKALALEKQNLNTIITALAPLIQADAILTNKQLIMELNQIPDLLLDSKEIRQLILNLARNGLEAMSPNSELIIRTYVAEEKVLLVIKDTGTGIAPEHLDKIATPFFSTKENKPGLGLAISYSIAARHHSEINFITNQAGTTFYVKFNPSR